MAIDPTARVADGARIGPDVEIGPYCLIGPQVELGRGVHLVANVHVTGVTTIGDHTIVYPFVSLGTPPQSVHYRGGTTRLVIGAHCELREGVTMNTGTEGGGGLTTVGERCLFMVGSHVAHDCHLGDGVTFANNVVVGGHVSVGANAFLGGHAAVHQFVRIGEGAMVGGVTGVAADVIPFGYAFGGRAVLVGLNVVGLRRRGASRGELHQVRRAYRALFFGDGAFADRIDAVAGKFADEPLVGKIVTFVRADNKRPLMQPQARRGDDEPDGDAA
jgi:UDP-N-acetylglucosamine acyltransferase